MNLFAALFVGGIAGWLANLVMSGNARMGLIANIVLGLVGGALGYFFAAEFGLAPGGVGGLIVALIGAIVLLWLIRTVGVRRKLR